MLLQKINRTMETKAVKELDYTAWRKSSFNHPKIQDDSASYSSVLSAMLQSGSSDLLYQYIIPARQCSTADRLKQYCKLVAVHPCASA